MAPMPPALGLRLMVATACALAALSASTAAEGGRAIITLVHNSRTDAVIVLAAGAGERVAAAAETLSTYVRRSTGADLAIERGAAGVDRTVIRLGVRGDFEALGTGLDAMDEDAFAILFPDDGSIRLVGASEYGAEHAVFEFLERYVGVRWLYPGVEGEHVPRMETIRIPRRAVRQTPAFLSRLLSLGSSSAPLRLWTRRLRIRGRTSFHHNLCNLLPPEVYAESHPHFFPDRRGEAHNWNPDLRAEGLFEEAVRRIADHFEAHPGRTTCSLGMNDAVRFPGPAKGTNSLGIDHQSDHYYAWANRVADAVRERYPRATFGCLAYQSTTDPPSFEVRPGIIPYICYDRMQWLDGDRAEADMARTRAWHAVCPTLGWYDYIYGRQYRLPRIYFHLMGRYLAFAHANGVRDYYGEAYPSTSPIEGPKLYLLARLLWDPGIDVDATLREWYRCAVGDDAAAALEAYFDHWESFWTQRVPRTSWFTSASRAIWLPFGLASYTDALTVEDLRRCEHLLNEVVARAVTPAQQARARAFRAAFEGLKGAGVMGQIAFKALNGGTPAADGALVFRDTFDAGEAGEGRGAARGDWVGGLPSGWSCWQRGGCTATFGWDPAVGHDGPGALVVDARGARHGPVVFIKTVPSSAPKPNEAPGALAPLKHGRVYRVECWARTEGLASGAAVEMVLKWFDGAGRWLDASYRRAMPLERILDGRWQRISACFTLPEAARTFVCMPSVERTDQGRAWFDDVALFETRDRE